ncbi:MAG TPA: ornithine cyclodeaminase family protein [Pyrinomonadaceae bacterium]
MASIRPEDLWPTFRQNAYQHMLLLNRTEISNLLTLGDYIKVVEDAFRLYAEGKTPRTALLHVDGKEGEFHVKAGGLGSDRIYFGLKVNGGFFQNQTRFGLPNIQGAIYLADATNGTPLALMDSKEITIKRTGAATAVAAKYLARRNSKVVTICGCGNQGRIQLEALMEILPISRVHAFSRNRRTAELFAQETADSLHVAVDVVTNLNDAIRFSDVCVTCTPAKSFFVSKESVSPGTFIAAVGADSPDKQELDPELLASSKVVVDILEQCAHVGELHHALEAGLLPREYVHAEVGEIIAGRKQGRTSDQEITIFDSTGTALQDVAAAAAIYERAIERGIGQDFKIAG